MTRDGSFEPKIVKKRQRRLAGVDELVISLAAKGLTTGEIAAHLADVYGAEVSRDRISRITDAVLEELATWQSRPLDAVYPVVFIDAIHVKIRDGKVANRPVYTVVGVKYWHQVLSEILNRGTVDVLIVVCDGLRGLPEAIGDVWPLAIVQTCVLHLIRNTFRYASKADWAELARDLRPVYSRLERIRDHLRRQNRPQQLINGNRTYTENQTDPKAARIVAQDIEVGDKVTAAGGFFDFAHNQNGRAKNQIELHPLLSLKRM